MNRGVLHWFSRRAFLTACTGALIGTVLSPARPQPGWVQIVDRTVPSLGTKMVPKAAAAASLLAASTPSTMNAVAQASAAMQVAARTETEAIPLSRGWRAAGSVVCETTLPSTCAQCR